MTDTLAPVGPTGGGPVGPADGRRPPVIDLRGVDRTFGVDPPVRALRRVELVVWPGEWISIVGPSGSGKSTLLNVIGLLDRPTAGSYRLEGVDVAELDDLARAGLRGQRIGFVFQSFHLLAHRSVLENVMLAELYLGRPRQGRRQRAEEVLERVGMSDRAHFLPSRLSGGQKQRAAIARALMGDPALLLCDEPTGNLDSTTAATVLDLFARLSAEGLTLAVITHDVAVARRAPRQVRMVDGLLHDETAPIGRGGP